MKKVAFNNCYGGFGLSPLAITKFAEKKGITLYWYSREGFGNEAVYTRLDGIGRTDGMIGVTAFTKDLGETANGYPQDAYYYPSFYEPESRADLDLIAVIEELGEAANTRFSDIQIAKVPDGADFEIDEYDGSESVVPPRKEWSDYE